MFGFWKKCIMEELVRSVEEMRDLLVRLQSSPEDPQLLQSLLSGRYLPYSIPTVNCPKSTPFLAVMHIHIYGIRIQAFFANITRIQMDQIQISLFSFGFEGPRSVSKVCI
jgi:hypothetical protein